MRSLSKRAALGLMVVCGLFAAIIIAVGIVGVSGTGFALVAVFPLLAVASTPVAAETGHHAPAVKSGRGTRAVMRG